MEFDPVRTWLRYGISDLYFGYTNQSNDVCRYGTFFFIMAAEKHLKAVLIERHKSEYSGLSELNEKRIAVDKIALRYNHKFDRMIDEVAAIYQLEMGGEFVGKKIGGYDLADIKKSMREGYMETRYPVVEPTFRRYPVPNSEGAYHDPLGSSFFTEFICGVCQKCWALLIQKGIDRQSVLSFIEDQYAYSRGYDLFKKNYLSTL